MFTISAPEFRGNDHSIRRESKRTFVEVAPPLLDDAALRKRLGDAGRAHVARFAAPAVARQFLAAIGVT